MLPSRVSIAMGRPSLDFPAGGVLVNCRGFAQPDPRRPMAIPCVSKRLTGPNMLARPGTLLVWHAGLRLYVEIKGVWGSLLGR